VHRESQKIGVVWVCFRAAVLQTKHLMALVCQIFVGSFRSFFQETKGTGRAHFLSTGFIVPAVSRAKAEGKERRGDN
jgi:hypothetical protein